MIVTRWLPGLATLRTYKASSLPHDLAAGVTLGAVLVPVGLAYGELAGLPMAGLYGSMIPQRGRRRGGGRRAGCRRPKGSVLMIAWPDPDTA
jgi:MFS superfamily sulfate permease-like transporter